MNTGVIRSTVRAIIVQNDRLLLCRYTGATGDYFVCPGGGQRFCEDMKTALVRECMEEIGCRVDVGELVMVADGIFHTANDTSKPKRHQTEHHFVCTIAPGQTARVGEKPDADLIGIEWVPVSRLNDIRVYPAQLIEKLGGRDGFAGPVYVGTSG